MSYTVTFEARVETVVLGKATYTLIVLPPEAAAAFSAAGAKRVEGEINEHQVNLALSKAPVVEGVFLWAGRSLLDRIGLKAGDAVEVRLRPAPDDLVDLGDDLSQALRNAGVEAEWSALTAGKQRGIIYRIETARTATTRSKRIAELIRSLTETR